MKPTYRPACMLLVAAGLALGLAPTISACSETRIQESTGQFVDDATITTKVKAALLQDQSLKSLEIHVETYKGVVELSGFVNSPDPSARASVVARGVAGVRSAHNNLILKS